MNDTIEKGEASMSAASLQIDESIERWEDVLLREIQECPALKTHWGKVETRTGTPLNELVKQHVREILASISIHESGHAVIGYLCNNWDLEFVTINPTASLAGFARWRNQPTPSNLLSIRHERPEAVRMYCNRLLTGMLAGYTAQSFIDDSFENTDAYLLLEQIEEEALNGFGDESATDIRMAEGYAKVGYSRGWWRVIINRTEWLLDTFRIPLVWEGVEKLAEALIDKRTLEGDDIYDLLEEHFLPALNPKNDAIPLMTLLPGVGPKWRRVLALNTAKD